MGRTVRGSVTAHADLMAAAMDVKMRGGDRCRHATTRRVLMGRDRRATSFVAGRGVTDLVGLVQGRADAEVHAASWASADIGHSHIPACAGRVIGKDRGSRVGIEGLMIAHSRREADGAQDREGPRATGRGTPPTTARRARVALAGFARVMTRAIAGRDNPMHAARLLRRTVTPGWMRRATATDRSGLRPIDQGMLARTWRAKDDADPHRPSSAIDPYAVVMNDPMIQVRPAAPSDVPLILALIRELAEYERAPEQAVATEELLRVHLFGTGLGKGPTAECVIGEIGGRAEGFALYFHNFSTWLGKPGLYLEDLFVRPATRGKGLGRALFMHVARLAVERGCGRMEWSVLDWNTPAIEFYKALGAAPMDGWTVHRLDRRGLNNLVAGACARR